MRGELQQAMIEAALAGGRAILAVPRESAAVRLKADESLVTAADLAADAAIAAVLAARAPAIPVISEETTAGEDAATPSGPWFLVDPLDGTKEYVSGRGEYTVNIALVENGEAVAGVIYAPELGRIWTGARDRGAAETTVVDGRVGAWRAIAARTPPPEGPVAAVSRSHAGPETDAYLARLGVSARAARGSSLKFCLIAAGEADVYPRFGPTMEWDTAAGQAILEAAGGRVERLADGAPLAYGRGPTPGVRPFANPDFVAFGRR